jgi:DNA-binding XRE family transcriptional regulator
MRTWLRDLRTSHNLTMKEMGQKLDISESYYCAIENGDRQKKMDIVLVTDIARIFRIPISKVASYETEWAART